MRYYLVHLMPFLRLSSSLPFINRWRKYSKKRHIPERCYFIGSLKGVHFNSSLWNPDPFENISCSSGGSFYDPVCRARNVVLMIHWSWILSHLSKKWQLFPDPVDCTKNVVDFFMWFLCQCPLNTFWKGDGATFWGKFSCWVHRVK